MSPSEAPIHAIERGVAEGTIRRVDARKAATILWASWNGVISLASPPDELREDEEGVAAGAQSLGGSGLGGCVDDRLHHLGLDQLQHRLECRPAAGTVPAGSLTIPKKSPRRRDVSR